MYGPYLIDHGENLTGKDYFVGDVHGEHAALMSALNARGFDPGKDRLFSTGDLVDRGEDSYKCLALVNEPWFYAVLGNHEDLLIDALSKNRIDTEYAVALHCRNGGEWAQSLDRRQAALCIKWAQSLPLARQLTYRGKRLGVIHSDWRRAWSALSIKEQMRPAEVEYALWARPEAIRKNAGAAEGVNGIVTGHNHCSAPKLVGRNLCIDTLAMGGELTILDTAEVFTFLE